MRRSIKYLTAGLWVFCLLATATVVMAYFHLSQPASSKAIPDDGTAAPTLATHYYPVPAFSLRDENDKPVTDQTLKGKPWVAAFIFTNCASSCPMMSEHMAQLQKKITDPNVRLVSFTLDPIRDTPAVLKTYAAKFKANEDRWFFLTGTSQQMQDVARGMKIGHDDPLPGSDQIMHSTQFLLVDSQNVIRGIYDGTDATVLDKLAADAEKLAHE
jgi:protein SCO1/2